MLWSSFRVLMVSVIFAIVMTAFRVAPVIESLLAVFPALLVGVAMASLTTAFTTHLDEVTGLPLYFRFVVIPMFLFSGAFFPIEQQPDWPEPVAPVTPMYHCVEMARAIVIGTQPAVAPWISITYLTALTIAGLVIAMRPMREKLTP